MKKKNKLFFALIVVLTSCSNNDINSTSNSSEESALNSEEKTSENEKLFADEMYYKEDEKNEHFLTDSSLYSLTNEEISKGYKDIYDDRTNNISLSTIQYGEMFINGTLQQELAENGKITDDARYVFYTKDMARIVSLSEGYAFTIPSNKILKTDFTKSQYISKYSNDESIITISKEGSNPYNNWNLYYDSWLAKYLNSNIFFTSNNLKNTKDKSIESINGYQVYKYNIFIDDSENIERPYYNIAIIKKESDYKNFILLVMKSNTNQNETFDRIIASYNKINNYGLRKGKNYYELKIPSYWSYETQKYYKKLLEQDHIDWGIFKTSITEDNAKTVKENNDKLEQLMDYNFDILPTYTHIGRINNYTNFPLESLKKLASGNGFNNKMVVQFTLQFTTSNNTNLDRYTPMFDILRGKYDDYFTKMALDLKEYSKPVLFRLNNEMNSDWTSYCGMLTLLDPDIFIATWERMAKIFKDNGVDNVIYIFNPTSISCPYSSWGEDICYLPSMEYVQILGLTAYEMNNYTNGEEPESFYKLYSTLYNKNLPFKDFPAIISEFACGAGGSTSGKLGRNSFSQASWVEDMFLLLNNAKNVPFVKQIKGAVWFSVNDYDGKISNFLELNEFYNSLTIEVFKEGLQINKLLK